MDNGNVADIPVLVDACYTHGFSGEKIQKVAMTNNAISISNYMILTDKKLYTLINGAWGESDLATIDNHPVIDLYYVRSEGMTVVIDKRYNLYIYNEVRNKGTWHIIRFSAQMNPYLRISDYGAIRRVVFFSSYRHLYAKWIGTDGNAHYLRITPTIELLDRNSQYGAYLDNMQRQYDGQEIAIHTDDISDPVLPLLRVHEGRVELHEGNVYITQHGKPDRTQSEETVWFFWTKPQKNIIQDNQELFACMRHLYGDSTWEPSASGDWVPLPFPSDIQRHIDEAGGVVKVFSTELSMASIESCSVVVVLATGALLTMSWMINRNATRPTWHYSPVGRVYSKEVVNNSYVECSGGGGVPTFTLLYVIDGQAFILGTRRVLEVGNSQEFTQEWRHIETDQLFSSTDIGEPTVLQQLSNMDDGSCPTVVAQPIRVDTQVGDMPVPILRGNIG